MYCATSSWCLIRVGDGSLAVPTYGGFRNLQTVLADGGMNLTDELWKRFTTTAYGEKPSSVVARSYARHRGRVN